MSKKRPAIVLLVVLVLAVWAFWRIFPYLPFIPHDVRLSSATYLRSPHVYLQSPVGYDPAQAPLAPEWVRLSIERENKQAFFESSTGERVRVRLGKLYWVQGCENQYRMEVLPLETGLTLGPLAFQQPVLIVVCDMWAAGEKIRPATVVLWEGPISQHDPFYLGVQCHPGGVLCLVFAQAMGELEGAVTDAATGEALPAARILLSSGMGIQEFAGSFRLPVYARMQVAYQISMPGYADLTGEIQNSYQNKLFIQDNPHPDGSERQGAAIDLPGDGQQVEYTFVLSKK